MKNGMRYVEYIPEQIESSMEGARDVGGGLIGRVFLFLIAGVFNCCPFLDLPAPCFLRGAAVEFWVPAPSRGIPEASC